MPSRMPFFSPKKCRKRSTKPTSHSLGYGGKEWAAIRKRILIRDAYQCRHCSRVCGSLKEAHIDHITPKRLSGSNDESNLQVLCASCHAKKTKGEMRALASR